MMAVFKALEVTAHVVATPAGVFGKRCDVVPIVVMGINEDHRVMRGASAQSSGARVKNPIHPLAVTGCAITWIELLLVIVGVVTHKEVPAKRLVFRGKGVEAGNIVVSRQPIAAGIDRIASGERARVAPRFQQEDAMASLG